MARFCVAACPKCEKRFRLVWRIGGRRLSYSQMLRLTCPHCGSAFEPESVNLVIFESGAEEFPVIFTVEPACLVEAATYDVEPREE